MKYGLGLACRGGQQPVAIYCAGAFYVSRKLDLGGEVFSQNGDLALYLNADNNQRRFPVPMLSVYHGVLTLATQASRYAWDMVLASAFRHFKVDDSRRVRGPWNEGLSTNEIIPIYKGRPSV